MKFKETFKDKKFLDRIYQNVTALVALEFYMYIVLFELSSNIDFKIQSFVLAGIVAMIAVIFFALGIGNKHKKMIRNSCVLASAAVFTFLSYFALTQWIAPIKIGGISCYTLLPFVMYAIFFTAKIVVLFKNKMKK